MGVLADRLIADGTQYRLKSDGSAGSDRIGRLVSGELPYAMVKSDAIAPVDLIAVLAHNALGGDDSLGLPLVQAPPRNPGLARALSESAWARVFPSASSPSRLP